MQKNSVIISLVFLLTGFIAAYFIFGGQTEKNKSNYGGTVTLDDGILPANPFITKDSKGQDGERLSMLENEIFSIKQQLQAMNLVLQELTQNTESSLSTSPAKISNRSRFTSALTQRLYNLDNLIRGGIDPSLAEDIVRRKNSIELKRLALQDLATRDNYLNTPRYFDELSEINKLDVTLREELGDQRYDEYLFNSKQNNRVKIISVMLGSEAEQAGIKKGDIVLSYDNQRIFSWRELKAKTAEGQLGEYVSISVYRNAEVFSFSVPRGPLGTQLGATRLAP